MHRIEYPPVARATSVSSLKLSFTIGLLTCFLAATTALSNAEEGQWSERYSEYQTSARQEKTAGKTETEMSGPLFAVVSIGDQRMSVYGPDGLAARVPVSTGMRGHPTPTGVFSIVQKKRFHRSNIYSGAPMPYMQRITWSGIALHAGVLPGYPASHGCIRLPASFAPRLYSATEMGQRIMIAPRDATPVEIAHKTLPAPALQPAPAGAEVSAAETGAMTASIDAPQPQTSATLEKVSISDAPAEAKALNPLEFARAMKRDATEKARLAARATREATLLRAKKMTEWRIATRKFASAENMLENAEDKLAAMTRRLERAEADAAATKEADAKRVEAKLADVKEAEAKAAEAKAAQAKADDAMRAQAALAAAKAAEAKAAEARLAEAEATQVKAENAVKAQAAEAEAKTAEAKAAGDAQPAGANAAQAKAEEVMSTPTAEAPVPEARPATINAADSGAPTDAVVDEKQRAAELAQKAADDAGKATELAQRAADEARKAAELTQKAADEARKAAEKSEKSAANARETADEAQKAAEARAVREREDVAKATEAKAAAEAALADARKALDDARAVKEARQQEMDAARRIADEAKSAGRAAAQSLAEANRRLKPLSVFISRKTGRLYVRQDWKPLFDAPITITDPERPVGTHLFVSTAAADDGITLKWSAVTMPFLEPEPKAARRDRKRGRSGDDQATAPAPAPVAMPEPETAAGALDRIIIPEETSRRLAELAWVGAAVIVSDNGISGETGETTDFIILTRSRASAP